ncbi:MAG: hypothetical protein KGS49_10965 [Planctomycetes bacterium]|nr:hypothetical protein [Planctomycetota bacterium]
MVHSVQSVDSGLLGYLCVDRFLANPISVSALHYCFSRGWIERWSREERVQFDNPPPNMPVLMAMLMDAGVISAQQGVPALTNSFRQALEYSDLLATKIEFCHSIIADVELFSLWMEDPQAFQKQSKLFGLFDYGRSVEISEQNIRATSRWVKLTTVLSRYEAPLFVDAVPWGDHRRWLDLGGNSGEFAMQICKRFGQLQARVMDLPVVCHLGQRHVEALGMSDRVVFEAGDFLQPVRQPQYDLISFKSVLHDWPVENAVELIRNAWDRLLPGGRLLILERSRLPGAMVPVGLGQAPVWMFWNYYRIPSDYESILDKYHHVCAETQILNADMPWMVLQFIKPSS